MLLLSYFYHQLVPRELSVLRMNILQYDYHRRIVLTYV